MNALAAHAKGVRKDKTAMVAPEIAPLLSSFIG
jgi:hypothetical protein